LEGEIVANPQPEPFLKFSKELFDALLLSSMPAGHKEIVLAIIRRTYGDHGRKVAPVSYAMIRQMTGQADSGIRRSVKALEDHGVIVKMADPTFRTAALWRLNKDYETWGTWSVDSANVVADRHNIAECQELAEGTSRRSATVVAEDSANVVADRSANVVAPLEDHRTETSRASARGDDSPSRTAGELATWAAVHVTGWEASPEDPALIARLLRTWPETQLRNVLGAMAGSSGKRSIGSPRSYLESSLKREYPPGPKREPTVINSPAYVPFVAPEEIVMTPEERATNAEILRQARLAIGRPVAPTLADDFRHIDFDEATA
jgi:hypothetical protein